MRKDWALVTLLTLNCTHAPSHPENDAGWLGIAAVGDEHRPPCSEPLEEVQALLTWQGHTVLRTDLGPDTDDFTYRVLDVATGFVTPLRVPGLDRVILLTDGRGGPAWVLGLETGKPKLLSGVSGQLNEVPLPPALAPPVSQWALSAEGDTLVLSDGHRLYWHSAEGWQQQPWPEIAGSDGAAWTAVDAHFELWGGTLYIGYDVGEFGGGLFALKWGQKALEPVCSEDSPAGLGVLQLHATSARLWVLQAVAHMNTVAVRLSELDASGCRRVLSERSLPGEPELVRIDAMALDGKGTPYLLSPEGVLEEAASGWEVLNPDMGEYLEALACHPASGSYSQVAAFARSLAIVGDEAVAGTSGFGVLLWNLETQRVRRVALPTVSRW